MHPPLPPPPNSGPGPLSPLCTNPHFDSLPSLMRCNGNSYLTGVLVSRDGCKQRRGLQTVFRSSGSLGSPQSKTPPGMSGKIQEAFSDAAQTQVNTRPFIRLSKNIPNLFSQNFDACRFTKERLWVNVSLDPIVDLLLEAWATHGEFPSRSPGKRNNEFLTVYLRGANSLTSGTM